MKKGIFFPVVIRFSLIVCLFFTGCTARITNSPVIPTPTSSFSPTHTPFASPDIPPTKTITPLPAFTHTPAPTFTAFPNATWTPLPTLSSQEAQAKVMELIATNGGCRLPCWWGIKPGETSLEGARHFLETIATDLTIHPYHSDYSILFSYENLPENISEGSIGAAIYGDDKVVQKILMDIYYPLDEILREYGEPDEVRVYVDNQSIDKLAPFVIALYYGEQGFLANYGGRTEKGEINKICPSAIEGSETGWFLWSSEVEMTFDIAGRKELLFVSPSDRRFWKVEQVTNMDARQFYEVYRDPANLSKCFDFKVPGK